MQSANNTLRGLNLRLTVYSDAVDKPVPGLSLSLIRADGSSVCHDESIVAAKLDSVVGRREEERRGSLNV